VKRLLALMIAIISIALACPVLAQPGPGGAGGTEPGGGPGPGLGHRRVLGFSRSEAFFMRTYNPQTVITVKGAVVSLTLLRGGPGAMRRAVLKTEQGNLTVYLSPDWYLNQEKISLKTGDHLEVTGSKVTLGQEPAIIAKDLKKAGGKTIKLRDDQGVPAWLGERPAGGPAK
jgi:hypothetical protein